MPISYRNRITPHWVSICRAFPPDDGLALEGLGTKTENGFALDHCSLALNGASTPDGTPISKARRISARAV